MATIERSPGTPSTIHSFHPWRPQEFVCGLAKGFSNNLFPKLHRSSTQTAPMNPSTATNFPVLFTDFPILNIGRNNLVSPSPLKGKTVSSPSSPSLASPRSPSSMRIDGLNSSLNGGPAFVGQVFSMLDPSGTGLMSVTTHFQIPFLSRAPDWLKSMLPKIFQNEGSGPVFRFFMDLGDAVNYVKRLNIPTGMVGACRLDVAYEHFKEKPHMFKFVPNKKQVKAARVLLKEMSQGNKKRIDGVPVFTAQNLSIAIATTEGIKWYKPYFFDKSLLDNILENSVDQHFHALIQTRHMQRRKDVIDDNLPSEMADDSIDSLFEPPEVHEMLEEMGPPGIPLSVISKAAEIQMYDTVDRVLLGNRWLRKATGIQPKFLCMVDSFEERSAASFLKVTESSDRNHTDFDDQTHINSKAGLSESLQTDQYHIPKPQRFPFRFPLWDLFQPSISPELDKEATLRGPDARDQISNGGHVQDIPTNPLLPKITMVGISTSEPGRLIRSGLKKTMDDLTRELEQANQKVNPLTEDNDPLFVANVGDYSNFMRTRTA